jgi:hypothetical protein
MSEDNHSHGDHVSDDDNDSVEYISTSELQRRREAARAADEAQGISVEDRAHQVIANAIGLRLQSMVEQVQSLQFENEDDAVNRVRAEYLRQVDIGIVDGIIIDDAINKAVQRLRFHPESEWDSRFNIACRTCRELVADESYERSIHDESNTRQLGRAVVARCKIKLMALESDKDREPYSQQYQKYMELLVQLKRLTELYLEIDHGCGRALKHEEANAETVQRAIANELPILGMNGHLFIAGKEYDRDGNSIDSDYLRTFEDFDDDDDDGPDIDGVN